jgi:hypothetical protein
MAAAILLSGNNYSKVDMFCQFFGLSHIQKTTYYQTQRRYLCPTIEKFWCEEKKAVLGEIGHRALVVCGDGRNDSPGHSAKYCQYTTIDAATNKILDLQVVDKREVNFKSVRMEKLGLQRALDTLASQVNVTELVTDASTSIQTMTVSVPKNSLLSSAVLYDKIFLQL